MARAAITATTVGFVKASLTTALAGANNDIVYTAVDGGPGGNQITVQYLVSGASTAYAFAVNGFDILVTSATSGASAATTLASTVLASIQGSIDASRLVTVAYSGADTGAGTIATLAKTNLASGALQTIQQAQTAGDATNGNYFTGNTGEYLLEANNTDGASKTVTVYYSPTSLPGVTVATQVITLTTTQTGFFTFSPGKFNQNAAGDVYFDTNSANVKYRLYKVAKAA